MLKAYFDSIPVELEEATQVDGYTPLGTQWCIVLSVSLPGLGATALYAFILSWNEFAFSRTLLIGIPTNWTVTVGIASIKGECIVSWNEVMAASAIAAAPIIIVFMFLERYSVAGLTAGAQKQLPHERCRAISRRAEIDRDNSPLNTSMFCRAGPSFRPRVGLGT